MNRPSFLGADGLPFASQRFELDGRMPSLKAFIDADLAGTPVPVDRSLAGSFRGRGLTDLDLVTFPGERPEGRYWPLRTSRTTRRISRVTKRGWSSWM